MSTASNDLRYRLYAHKREQGMTAAIAAGVFGADAVSFEARFQQEMVELSERVAMAGFSVGDHIRPVRDFRSQASKRVMH